MMSNFEEDLKLSQNDYIAKQMDAHYNRIYPDCIVKRYEKDMVAQYDYKVDVIVTEKDGTKHFIDEKIRRANYKTSPLYPIELWSNVQKKKRGWTYSSGSQEIVFIQLDENNKVLYVLNFSNGLPLRLLAEKEKRDNPNMVKWVNNTYYHTEIVLIHYRKLMRLQSNVTILDDMYFSIFEEQNGR